MILPSYFPYLAALALLVAGGFGYLYYREAKARYAQDRREKEKL